jgi:CDP-glycerol glycerophosphotransferase (TagB/SpsB family)
MANPKTAYPIQWAAGMLSCLLSGNSDKDPARIVLTSFHGDGYRGNTRVLFERLCRHPELKPVWLSRNPCLVRKLRDTYGANRACLTHSLSGIRALRSAGAVFLTHGTSDYPFMRLPRRALIIQAYHGLPTKRGEYLRPRSENKPSFLHRKILEYRFRPVTHFLSSSLFVTELFSSRFNIPRERFLETGYPAYDALVNRGRPAAGTSSSAEILPEAGIADDSALSADESLSVRFSRFWPDAPAAQKLILYAPTFRRAKRTRWFPFDDRDLHALARWLDEHNALMALRAHPNEGLDMRPYRRISSRFVPGGQESVEDVFDLLPFTDVIMSDYSSIFIEGLLLDIPAVLLPYDLASYERGLPLPYDQMAPGPTVFSHNELLNALDCALDRTDGFHEDRKRIRERYFSSQDGNATDRVIRFLEEQLSVDPVQEAPHPREHPLAIP